MKATINPIKIMVAIALCALAALARNSACAATLVTKWSFEGNANDTSGNNNNGTVNGPQSFVPGKFGQGIYLNGSSTNWVQKTSANNLPIQASDSWSYNVWVYLTNAPAQLTYFAGFGSLSSSANKAARGIIAYPNQTICQWDAINLIKGTATFPQNAWAMLTVTHDGPSTLSTVYLNGTSVASGNESLVTASPSQVQVGSTVWAGSSLNGIVDEFTLWSGVLSTSDIANLYAYNNAAGNLTAAPGSSLAPGVYWGATNLTLTSETGSTVFYTTDGSAPTSNSPNGGVGTGSATVAIVAPSTMTIIAYATNSAKSDSLLSTNSYTILALSSGTWTNLAGGAWIAGSNWSGGAVAGGAGNAADFSTLTLTANTAVTLNSSPVIGSLAFADAGASFNWIIDPGAPTSGTLTLASTTAPLIAVNNQSATINAALAGTNGFLKSGSGQLILTAANSYTGTTAVSNGTLKLSDIGPFYQPISNAATVVLYSGTGTGSSGNGGYILGGSLSGTGSWLVDGDATGGDMWHSRIILNNVNNPAYTFTGTVSLTNSGRLWLQAGGTNDLTCGNGATFDLASASSTLAFYANNAGRTFTIGGLSGSGTVDLPDPGSGNSSTLVIGDQNVSSAFSGVIRNSGSAARRLSLTKVGTGTLTLSGNNTYTGNTAVSNGVLMVNGYLAAGSSVSVAGGRLSGANGTINGPVTVNAGGTFAPGGASFGAGPLYLNNTLTLSGQARFRIDKTGGFPACDLVANMTGVTYGGTLVVTNITSDANVLTNGDTFTLFTKSSGTYGGSFTNFVLPALGPGLTWDKSRLFVDGTIAIANVTATPFFTPPAGGYVGSVSVTISSDAGATIFYTTDGSDPTTSGTRIAGISPISGILIPSNTNITLQAYATNSGLAPSPLASALYQTLSVPTWTASFGGVWSDAFNWSNNVVGNGAGVLADFSQLDLFSDSTVDLNGSRTIGSLVFGDTTPDSNWIITNSVSGVLTLDNGANAPVINVSNQTTIVAAQLAGTNGLTKIGNGTLKLTVDSAYSGGTSVNAGTLLVAGPNTSNSRVGAGMVTINSPGSMVVGSDDPLGWGGTNTPALNVNGGTVDSAGYYLQFRALTMTGGTLTRTNNGWISYDDVTVNASAAGSTIAGGDFWMRFDTSGNTNGTRIFTVADGSAAADLTVSSRLVNAGGGISGLLKAGSGTMVLTATNTYKGATTVSNGTLLVHGSLASGSVVTVAGGTLGGTGTVGSAVNVQVGGTLSPGPSIATLTINSNLTLAGNVLIQLDKSLAQSNDIVNVTGTINYGGTLTAENIGAPALVLGDSFQVFPAGGSGSFAAIAGSPGVGLNWSFNPASGVLSVVAGVATNPTNLVASVSGGQLTLSWPADHTGWTLQAQTNTLSVGLTGTWYDVAGSTTTNQMNFSIDHTKPTVFYRMKY
jgi:autotransporter-associated beta strand protein